MTWNICASVPSGGQVVKPTRPLGLHTRAISAAAALGSFANMTPHVETTTSKLPSSNRSVPDEVERLMTAARSRPGRYGQRDATMILLAYRHGLRVSELVGLRWDMLDLAQGHLHVQRFKNGRPSVHTVRGTELRALRRLQRDQAPPSPFLFTTERRTPMSAAGFRKQLAMIRGGG